MTMYSVRLPLVLPGHGDQRPADGVVVPVVVPRPSASRGVCRSLARSRLWGEGTDPAPRGREWRSEGGQPGKGAA